MRSAIFDLEICVNLVVCAKSNEKCCSHACVVFQMFVCQWIPLPERNRSESWSHLRFYFSFSIYVFVYKHTNRKSFIVERYFDYLAEINIDSSPSHTNHSLSLCLPLTLFPYSVLFTKKYTLTSVCLILAFSSHSTTHFH